jgi:FKBP-type peptidyl-prolyl cis-trans isomerase
MIIAALFLPLAAFLQGTGSPALTVKDDHVGEGRAAEIGQIVTVNYTGTLPDGTTFDSTTGKDPFSFILGVGLVIQGWDKGILGMKEGGTRELTIPPTLGYGNRTAGPIPANSILKFKVDLVRIEPKVTKKILTKGAGPIAKVGDIVSVNLSGGVKDAKPIFDSSDQKAPIRIKLGLSPIPIGLTSALLGMQAGETCEALLPPSVAFKDKGVPPADENGVKAGTLVPPNSTMDFKIEVVKIETSPAPQASGSGKTSG